MESSGRLGVYLAGITQSGAVAAVQDPTDASVWYCAQEWPNSVVIIWKHDPVDERVKIVGSFFPVIRPWQWLRLLNGGDFI